MDQAQLNAAVATAVAAALAQNNVASPAPENTRELLRGIAIGLRSVANDPNAINAMAQEFANMADHMENGASLTTAFEARATAVSAEQRLIAQLGRTITAALGRGSRGRRASRGRGRGRAN